MKQHTPTPWTIRPVFEQDGKFEIRSEGCKTLGYAPLAYVRGDKRLTGGDGQPNAEFIVRACNAYDGLTKALSEAIDLLSRPPAKRVFVTEIVCLRLALAAATAPAGAA